MAEELEAAGDGRGSPTVAHGLNLAFAAGFLEAADPGLFLGSVIVFTAVAGATISLIFVKVCATASMSKAIETDHTCVDGCVEADHSSNTATNKKDYDLSRNDMCKITCSDIRSCLACIMKK